MAVYSGNRAQTLYAQIQTGGARTVNNGSGTWTNTNTAKLRYYSWEPKAENPINSPDYKTGNSSAMLGVRGRQAGSGTLNKPFFPSGAAGTAPDDAVILQTIFGAAGTVVTSTSVTYSLSDTISYLFMPCYNKNAGMSSPTNTYLLGATPASATFKLNGNFLDYSVEFVSVGRGDSQAFSSYTGGDALLKGALTTYPAEPSGITQNGNAIPGFGSSGSALFGGSALAELRGPVEITIDTGISGIDDAYADAYRLGFLRGKRSVKISKIQCVDSDGTVLNTLKARSFDKTGIAIALTCGGTAGSIVTFNLANVQCDGFEFSENGDALDVTFPNAIAHQTTSTALDETSLVLT